MDKELAASSTRSDIILSSKSEDEEEEEEEARDTKKLKEKARRWSSRFKCYEAYACSISCYSAFQVKCLLLSNHGIFAFIPVILFKIFVGVPAAIIQIILGRFIMTNVSKTWSMHVMAKGVLICEIAVTCYYTIHGLTVSSFLVEYMFSSFTIPWKSCNATWATISCYESQQFQKFLTKCLEYNTQEFCKNLNWKSSEAEYWKYTAAYPYNAVNLLLVCFSSFIVSIILFAIIVKGVRSAEKSFAFFVIISVVLSLLMTCIICTSSEFSEGFKKVFDTDSENLLRQEMWVEAFDTTIFILGVGRLPLAFVSSHANFEDDFFSEVLVVCIVYIFFCLLITMPNFCVMEVIKSNDYTPKNSDSLDIFILLSEIVILFPPPKQLWAVLYYLLLLLITMGSLGISMLALVEAVSGFLPDHFSNFYTSLILCLICFFASIMFIFCDFNFSLLLDKSVVSVLFLYLLTLEIFYGLYMLADDFHFMMGYPVPFFLKSAWIISLPISLAMIVLNAIIYHTGSSNVIYFFLGIPLLIYVISASVQIGISIYHTKSMTRTSQLFSNDPDWGPADPVYKRSRILFDSHVVTKEFMYRQELREKVFLKAPDISQQSIVHVV